MITEAAEPARGGYGGGAVSLDDGRGKSGVSQRSRSNDALHASTFSLTHDADGRVRSGEREFRATRRKAGPRGVTAAAGHRRLVVPGAGGRLLRRLSGLPDLPRPLDQLHRLQVPRQPAGALGRLRQLRRCAPRPADVGEPVARARVHDHVPAGNDHPAAAARHPHRPGDEPASGDLLSRGPAHSGGDPEHARLRAVEVDVQLPERPDQSSPGRYARPVHVCRTRRNGWAGRR